MNADLKRIRTAAETAVIESFASAEEALPGNAAVHADRRQRMALFERDGLPHRRVEEWKYTDLRTLVRDIMPTAQEAGQVDVPAPMLEGALQIIMVDGFMASSADLPNGVTLTPLMDALADGQASLAGGNTPDRAIDALNAAFVRDGYALTFAKGADVSTPLELVFMRSNSSAIGHARAQISVGEGAKATIIERHISADDVGTQSSMVTNYAVGEGAELSVLRTQNEGNEAVHLGELTLDLAAKSQARLLHLVAGAKVARTETRVIFAGEEARLDVAGITMVADRQHSDTTLYVDHLVPHCDSTETFKAVIDDAAKAIFQGKIVVAQDAQKVDAQMAINSLLLSETADMVAKPELEIFADDVSCAHGATCGDIDEDLMFYLLARGIAPNDARKLLLQAFLSEGADLFEGHPFEQLAFDAIEAWLSAHAAR
ncbi:MAG: Fe-S cluster assembly protein SufD [Devosiaceae bacterium]